MIKTVYTDFSLYLTSLRPNATAYVEDCGEWHKGYISEIVKIDRDDYDYLGDFLNLDFDFGGEVVTDDNIFAVAVKVTDYLGSNMPPREITDEEGKMLCT